MKTLNQFLAQHLPEHKLPQELASVLESVAAACLDINAKVRLGALSGVLGMAGTGNNPKAKTKRNLTSSPTTS